DWYETVTDPGAKLYGSTDPLNRDSDNDGAIDGGESNVYPDTPIDSDNKDEVGSAEQTCLNGGKEEWARGGEWGTLSNGQKEMLIRPSILKNLRLSACICG
ncbi:MAG: hypothetical protein SCH39_10260, partial [Methanosarcinales archaeon]|nr:hypothetical protein [Methanosarcinales archaeon]